jgi:4-hydroxy-3-methylbut-2-enyl diphosphate reductase IspH
MDLVIMMKVTKISPQGYCKGVILAIKKVLEVINDPTTIKPIYLLGMIIHNRFVCMELERMGVTILEGIDKLKLIDNIESGTVIISAHGVSNKVKEKILNMKFVPVAILIGWIMNFVICVELNVLRADGKK